MEADKLQPAPKGCWALCLGDCGEGMTGEHLVSKSLFDTNEIIVQGFPWCLDTPKKIGLASLVANILCKKHNSALSELDTAASNASKVFREAVHLNHVRQKLKRQPAWNVKRYRIDGPRLERWFLKTLINISFGGQWTIGPGTHTAGCVSCDLVETAFGRRPFGIGAGMYTIAHMGQQVVSEDRVNFTPLTQDNNLNGARFNFRGHSIFLNLLPQTFKMDGQSNLWYRQVTHEWPVHNRLSHVVSINGW
jgi:hypothetical protein